MASRGSKIALASTSLFAVTTIVLVHFQQSSEKAVCIPNAPRLKELQLITYYAIRQCTKA